REPPLALGGEWLQRQPAPVADLDRVGTAARGQQAQDVALEEGRVHAELQGEAPAERGPQAVDHLACRNAPLRLESCRLPGQFFTRRMWPFWATWARTPGGRTRRATFP